MASVYQLTLTQSFLTEPQMNVFHYYSDDAGVAAGTLVEAFIDEVLPLINGVQVDDVTNALIRCISLFDLEDFAEAALSGGGIWTSDPLPPFNVLGYTFRLDTRALRPGSKRFTGVPESVQASGTITDAEYLGDMNDLRVQLLQSLPAAPGTGPSFAPIVVKRVREVETVEGVEKVSYRLPENEGELVFGNVTTVLTTARVGHQVSKFNGR